MAGVDAVEVENWLHWHQRFLAVLRGAAGRSQGQLCQLDVSQHDVPLHELLPVLTANAGSLRELHLRVVDDLWDSLSVEAVVAAAPLLQVLTAEDVTCKWNDAPRMLRAEPPFAPLQMRGSLTVCFHGRGWVVCGMERFGPFAAALADAALQPALLKLHVQHVDTEQPAVMGALADAALARRLRELSFEYCSPPAAGPLARLLTEGSLASLRFANDSEPDVPLFDAAGAALVAGALRVNTTLTKLKLCYAGLCVDMHAADILLGALMGHPSLRELYIGYEGTTVEDGSAFGAALAALIAANAPALLVLVCRNNYCYSFPFLGDAHLSPIVEALPLNRHLRELDLRFNGMSEAFARERLLPAVRANTTLRELYCADYRSTVSAAKEAEELVRSRGLHD
jgi:hypothetical protein